MPRFQPPSRRGSAAQSFLLIVLVVAMCFGAYLAWRKFEKDRLAAEAGASVPVEPPKKRDYDIPDPAVIKDEPVTPAVIPIIPAIDGKSGEPAVKPPPPFDLKEPDKEVQPRKNPVASASEIDRRIWDAIRSPKKKGSMLKDPFQIPILEMKRRRELDELVSAYEKIPVEACVEHPLAKDFPGDVPNRIKRWRTVRTYAYGQSGGWKSTGLYVPPGEIVTVELSEADAARGFRLQIGSHSDNILATKREAWHRFPRVLRSFPLDAPKVLVANPFGGLVFLQGPLDTITKENPLHLRYTGIVKAPVYFLDEMTKDEWTRLRVESKGVPWGELVGRRHVAMLPGEQMHDCTDPKKFAEYWDELVRLQDYLTGTEDTRGRAERFNADAEISIGAGHSGYPWCGYLDWAEPFTDPKAFRSDNWGINHEVGHNHQDGRWTFKGYGEVTNNLIGMYVMTTQAKMKFSRLRGGMAWKDLAVQAIAFKEKGDPFELLAYYVPVIEQFGWESLRKTFTSYHTEPFDDEDDDAKKAEFVYRWSVACGADLSDYSELFGFPKNHTNQYKFAQLKPKLKPWMPDGYPPSVGKIKRLARKKDPKFTMEDAHSAP